MVMTRASRWLVVLEVEYVWGLACVCGGARRVTSVSSLVGAVAARMRDRHDRHVALQVDLSRRRRPKRGAQDTSFSS